MKNKHSKHRVAISFALFFFLFSSLLFSSSSFANPTIIAPEQHPNLFFDRDEIAALRQAYGDGSLPQYAADAFLAIKDTLAVGKPVNELLNAADWYERYLITQPLSMQNMDACMSYVIEPTAEKRAALKDALISWTRTDDGAIAWAYSSQAGGHMQFPLTWMYDLLYNEGVLTSAEKAHIDKFMVSKARQFFLNNWPVNDWVTEEGSSRFGYQNTYNNNAFTGIIMSMVGHDQAMLDRAFVSLIADDDYSDTRSLMTENIRTLRNIINGEVFPSGYTWDGYRRNYGFDPAIGFIASDSPDVGQGQHYHFYSTMLAVLVAEAVGHNGFDAWGYNNSHLLKGYVKGAEWAETAYNALNKRNYNHQPLYWCIYRRFSGDAAIREAVSKPSAADTHPYLYSNVCRIWGALADLDGATTPPPSPLPTPTVTLGAMPVSADEGTSLTLSWSGSNVTSCTGTGFSTGGATSGALTVTPTATTTYEITCTDGSSNVTDSVTVTITPARVPAVTLGAAPTSIEEGSSSTLSWVGSNLISCTGTGFSAEGATNGASTVTPTVTTTYAVTCTDGSTDVSDSVTVTVTPQIDATGDLVAQLSFDDGSGTIAADSSGNANDGTLLGPVWTVGKIGGALEFDGMDDYLDLGTLDVAGSGLTLSAWVRSDNLNNCASGDCRIISKALGTSEQDHYWMLSTIDGASLRFRLKAGGVTATLIGGGVSADTWMHVAAVYDGFRMRIYKDGIEVASSAKTGQLDTNSAASTWVGSNPPGAASRPWNGAIDDVRIYGRALSAAEIQSLSVAELPPPTVVSSPLGTASQVDSDWSSVDAPTGYTAPVVIVGPATNNQSDPGAVRLANVTAAGFDVRFQEWAYLPLGGGQVGNIGEDVSYVVLETGRHVMADGSVWEVGTFSLEGTGGYGYSVSFTEPFGKPPHVFLSVQTSNGPETVSVRVGEVTLDGFNAALHEEDALNDGHGPEIIGYLAIESPSGSGLIDVGGVLTPYLVQSVMADHRWLPVLSQRLRVEEEQSLDLETDHGEETLHVLALGKQLFAQQVSSNEDDTTSIRRMPATEDAPLEWGTLRGLGQAWTTLPFAKAYQDPVIVVKPTTGIGGDPGVVRIREVTSDRAQLRFQEWDYLDGQHATPEEVFYVVSEKGLHTVGGLSVEAGSLTSESLASAGMWETVSLSFEHTVEPVAFASVMTENGVDAVTTRIANLGTLEFEMAMDEQESNTDGHPPETLGWIAIGQGSGTTAEGYAIEAFSSQVSDRLRPVYYPVRPECRYPTVIADVNSYLDPDPVFPRYASPRSSSIRLQLMEEESLDVESSHVFENIGVLMAQ